MTEPSLSIVNASDGRLEGATVGDTALAVTHDGTGTTFTFTDNGTPFLVLAVRLDRSEDGSVTRASLAADGDTIQHRITFDFADDPGRAFSEGKLQAVVSVEGQPGEVHRGHFDGQTWQISGLDDAPVLPRGCSPKPSVPASRRSPPPCRQPSSTSRNAAA